MSRMRSLVLLWSVLLIFPTQCQGLRPPLLVRFREAKMPADLNALSAQREEEVAGLGAGVRAQPFITCEGLRTGRSVGVVGSCVLTGEIVASADIGLQDTSGTMAGNLIDAMPSGIGRVKNVLVTKKNRGTGLGRDVMEEAEKLAVEKRLCGLELEVDTANEAAFNLCKCSLDASLFSVFTSCLCYLCKCLALTNPSLRCPAMMQIAAWATKREASRPSLKRSVNSADGLCRYECTRTCSRSFKGNRTKALAFSKAANELLFG